MADLAPAVPSEPTRMTVERYFGLVETGVLSEDDRVELLEGVVVAMTPQNPPHAAGVAMANEALLRAIGSGAHVRPQLSLVLGRHSVPEPDLAVVPGSAFGSDFTGYARLSFSTLSAKVIAEGAKRFNKVVLGG